MLRAFKANTPVIVLMITDSAAGTSTETVSLKHDVQTAHFPAERAQLSEAMPPPHRWQTELWPHATRSNSDLCRSEPLPTQLTELFPVSASVGPHQAKVKE